ncbi:heterokaryon incompatibility protein-domain-containing protein [Bisporella sp. PMI_857]|nr:heterokaryon incompatibility protein-domain-containing protein [Bisporella sp. PMI_857]
MRLINVKTFKPEKFLDNNLPPYAILSHTWKDGEELTLRDIEEGKTDKPGIGSIKLQRSCKQAEKDGLGYIWIDTCCIDKTDSVELGEAINSMFRWYKKADRCYAYLLDVTSDENPRNLRSEFRKSRWFKRGWTLQELLAPQKLQFYSSDWRCLGTKGEMCNIIEAITGISRQFLLRIEQLHKASVAQRMSWAAQRETTRGEDIAYCLLGIFGVSLPMIYVEGSEQAFFRLQEQIMRTTRDDSILAWGLSLTDPISSDAAEVTPGRI